MEKLMLKEHQHKAATPPDKALNSQVKMHADTQQWYATRFAELLVRTSCSTSNLFILSNKWEL